MRRVYVAAIFSVLLWVAFCILSRPAYAEGPYPGKESQNALTGNETASQAVPGPTEAKPAESGESAVEGAETPAAVSPIARGGEEDWESYDEESGLPDVTESDRYGEVE